MNNNAPAGKKKDEEEDRKGLPPISLRAGAREAAALARGGLGAGGGGGLSALGVAFGGFSGKVLLVLLLGAAGLGAYGVGQQMAARSNSSKGKSSWVFDRKGASGRDGSAGAAGTPDSTHFLRGDGSLASEKEAADAAAAAAAADAAAKAKAAEDEKAKKDAEADAAAKAAAAAGEQKGGANPGGAGLTGQALGAGLLDKSKGFGAGDVKIPGATTMASAPAFQNSGLASGVGRKFDSNLGAAKAMPSASRRAMARAISAKPGGSGRAFRQLVHANNLSRAGAATTGEAASGQASDAFGGGIAANGPAPTPGGVHPTGVTGTPSDASYGGDGGPVGGGGGYSDGGGGGGTGGTAAPPDAGHADVSPFSGLAMAATGLLLGAGVLLLIGGRLADHAKKLIASAVPATAAAGAHLLVIAKIILGLAAMMGIAVMALGGMIASQNMGQLAMGGGLAAGGLLVTVLAIKELFAPSNATAAVEGATTQAQTAGGATNVTAGTGATADMTSGTMSAPSGIIGPR